MEKKQDDKTKRSTSKKQSKKHQEAPDVDMTPQTEKQSKVNRDDSGKHRAQIKSDGVVNVRQLLLNTLKIG